MKKTVLSLSMFMLAMLLLAAPAYADTLNLTLASPIQTDTPNATLTFDATVSAPLANNGTLFLNGDNFNVSLAGAIFDDTGFLFDFPLNLNPGGSFTGTLFTVTLPSIISSGTHNGFFEILGGSDPATQNTLASVNFQINTPTAVPEPSTWLLLATGLPPTRNVGIQTIECPIHACTLRMGGKVAFSGSSAVTLLRAGRSTCGSDVCLASLAVQKRSQDRGRFT